MAEHNTTFEVSSMTQLDNNSNVKALANVVINGEIAVNGVKVMEGEKGLFVAMPSKKVGGEFVDIAHPITDKAYEQISNAVLTDYAKLVSSGERTMRNELATDKTKPVTSDIDVSLRPVTGGKSVVAAGQVSIDECFVIKDIRTASMWILQIRLQRQCTINSTKPLSANSSRLNRWSTVALSTLNSATRAKSLHCPDRTTPMPRS